MGFAENLRRLRAERRLSQRALATAAGLTQMTIIRMERGQTAPMAASVARLAQALGVRDTDLAAASELDEDKKRRLPRGAAARKRFGGPTGNPPQQGPL